MKFLTWNSLSTYKKLNINDILKELRIKGYYYTRRDNLLISKDRILKYPNNFIKKTSIQII